MLSLSTVKRVLALTVAVVSLTSVAEASSFSSLVVYGDSLSDNGNLFSVSGFPPSPYFDGRRSNGPVAVERLATSLGVPLFDFAWIGATTGIGNFADGGTPTSAGAVGLPGMKAEFAATAGSIGPFVANGLFVVWGGPNDFLSPSPLDFTPTAIVDRAVGDELSLVSSLEGLGAHHILVPGMPDLGLTPYFQSGAGPVPAAVASALTDLFNAKLRAGLPADVLFYDTAGLTRSMVAHPADYGFTNVTEPCFNGLTVCANPSQYLYFDDFHPTAATHAFAAEGFRKTVPEPSTFVLLAAGLGLVARRRAARNS